VRSHYTVSKASQIVGGNSIEVRLQFVETNVGTSLGPVMLSLRSH
jgi:hypothetical protein